MPPLGESQPVPTPQPSGPAPPPFGPAPQPFGPAPQPFSPAPLANSPFFGLPLPEAPRGEMPTIEAPPSGSTLFSPMMPISPLGPLVENVAPSGTPFPGGASLGGTPAANMPLGGMLPTVNMPLGGMPAANAPPGGMLSAVIMPLAPPQIAAPPVAGPAVSDVWSSPMGFDPLSQGAEPMSPPLVPGMPADDPYAAGPMPADPAEPGLSIRRDEREGRSRSAAARAVGHVVAALLGLACGYGLLHMVRPGHFPLPW